MAISAGVYSKIIDLSNYVQEVPSSIGLFCGLTKKGEDNKLKFFGGRTELLAEYGKPNILDYGKDYSQDLYCAFNFLGESGGIYFMRCLPEDASYANLGINTTLATCDATSSVTVQLTRYQSLNSQSEINTTLATHTETSYPVCIFTPIGRGEYYNNISIKLTEYANPMYNGVYVLDVYEIQEDDSNIIVESFDVSFDPYAVDNSGDSIFIENVLSRFSSLIRCKINEDGNNYVGKVYDKNMGTIAVVETASSATISDTKQHFSDWIADSTSNCSNYVIIIKDQRGNSLWGYLGDVVDPSDDSEIKVYNSIVNTTQSWIGDVSKFDSTGDITYQIKKSNVSVASLFNSPIPLRFGNDGSLTMSDGSLNSVTATQILSNAFYGILFNPDISDSLVVDTILNTDDFYFNLVFDCGYPTEVKTAIVSLATTRRDCIAIIDNGDNTTYTASKTAREDSQIFNNYFTAIYEPYTKVYDSFTGQDVWFSPMYHMSYLIPRNDRVSEVWMAVAGLNRGVIENIKDMRFNLSQPQRDEFYLKQINPIIRLNGMYTVWSQLTSQVKPSALQDLNIVRLVLYADKALKEYCRFYIYEQNDYSTWSRVRQQVVEFLEDLKNRRGLYSYSVDVGATEYEQKQKRFSVNVILNPTRTTEQINLNWYIK